MNNSSAAGTTGTARVGRLGRYATAVLAVVTFLGTFVQAGPAAAAAICTPSAYGCELLAGSAWAPASVSTYFNDLNVYSNGSNYNNPAYQCTQLALRWAHDAWGEPSSWPHWDGSAADMFTAASYLPNQLQWVTNGSQQGPRQGDLLLFKDNGPGHVVVVTSVANGSVHFVGQNQYPYGATASVPISANNHVSVGNFYAPSMNASVEGWLHNPRWNWSNTPPRGWAVMMRHNGAGGYRVAPDGTVTSLAGAPPLAPSATWPGQNIVRGAVLRSDDQGGYVLDLYGAIHSFGAAPPVSASAYWPGWDIARGLVLRSDNVSGYVLDGYGGLHPFNGAPAEGGSAYWAGWDIATGIAGYDDNGGYVLDGYGGLHPFGDAPAVSGSAYWPGWDIANGIVTTHDGFGPGGYVLDGYGGMHPFGDAPPVAVAGYHGGLDTAAAAAITPHASTGYEVDTSGTVITVTGPTPGCSTCR